MTLQRLALFTLFSLVLGTHAHAQTWGNVATENGLTDTHMCDTDGTDIICESPNPTVDGSGNVTIDGTLNLTADSAITENGVNIFRVFDAATARDNIAIGTQTTHSSIDTATANNNLMIGPNAGQDLTTASSNLFVGINAGLNVTEGGANTLMGTASGVSLTTGTGNTLIGQDSGRSILSGSNNSTLGNDAGENLTTGSRNIVIGADLDAPSVTGSNQLVIGNAIFGTGLSGTGTTIAGNIGIGVADPDTRLEVAGTLKIADGGESCSAGADAGMLRYEGGDVDFCDGSAWTTLASAGSVTVDEIADADGNTKVQVEEGSNDDTIRFDAAGVEVATMNSVTISTNANINLADGNTVYSDSLPVIKIMASPDGRDNVALATHVEHATLDTASADNSLLIGPNAGETLSTGSNNTFVGKAAGSDVDEGDGNTALGSTALRFVDAANNTAIGFASLAGANGASSGGNNTALGRESGEAITTGSNNVLIGYQAAEDITSGFENTAVGLRAGRSLLGGSANVFVGRDAGVSVTTGINNTILGKGSGDNLISGDRNIIIGAEVDAPSAAGSNQLVIGNAIFGTGLTGTGTSIAGNIGIGVNDPDTRLEVAGTLKISDGGESCSTGADAGMIRYEGGDVDFCDGSAWTTLSSAGTNSNQIDDDDDDTRVTTQNSDQIDFVAGGEAVAVMTSQTLDVSGTYLINGSQGLAQRGNSYFVGLSSGVNLTIGTGNVGFGSRAAQGLTEANGVTAIGHESLRHFTEADGNTALGFFALSGESGASTGTFNTAIGRRAGNIMTTGSRNILLGSSAGIAMTEGSNNTILGTSAAITLTTGDNNVFVGDSAGDNVTTGSRNIVIGTGVDVPTAAGNNQLVIGNAIFGTGVSGTGTSIAGNIGIGVADPDTRLEVAGTLKIADGGESCSAGADAGMLRYNGGAMQYCNGSAWTAFGGGSTPDEIVNAAGDTKIQVEEGADDDIIRFDSDGVEVATMNSETVAVNGNITYSGTLTDTSDRRLKGNITPLTGEISKIEQLNPVSFTMNNKPNVTELGVIAQELETVYPELVQTADDEMGTKSVNYIGLIAPLIKSVQELKAENAALRSRIEALETQ